jgi:hypothetical protein
MYDSLKKNNNYKFNKRHLGQEAREKIEDMISEHHTFAILNSNEYSITHNLNNLISETFASFTVPVLLLNQNSSQNNSLEHDHQKYPMSRQMFMLISILYGAISIISVMGNFLIILVVMKNRPMQTVTNYFICNLALADIVIGIFVIPFQVSFRYF